MGSLNGIGTPRAVDGRRQLGPPPEPASAAGPVKTTGAPEPRRNSLVTPPDRSEPPVSPGSVGRPKRTQARPVNYASLVDGPDYEFSHDVSNLRLNLSPYANHGVATVGDLGHIFDPKTGELKQSLVCFANDKSRVVFHPDGKHIAIQVGLKPSRGDPPTVIYAADSGQPVDSVRYRTDYPLYKHEKLLPASQPDLSHIDNVFYQDARYALSGNPSDGYQLHGKNDSVVDLKIGPFEPIDVEWQRHRPWHAVSPSGQRLAIATKTPDKRQDSVLLTDGEGIELGRHQGRLLSFSEDERALFLLVNNGVRVVSAETGGELQVLEAPEGMKMEGAHVSHDGHIILLTLLDEAKSEGVTGPSLDRFPRVFRTYRFDGA